MSWCLAVDQTVDASPYMVDCADSTQQAQMVAYQSASGAFTFPDVFNIDPAGGALIAGAVLAVWAVGFGVRALIQALNSDGKQPFESEI
jgi:hypothetical protein